MPAIRTLLFITLATTTLTAQTTPATPPRPPSINNTVALPPATPTRAKVIHGAYGPFRANNDLLYYHLDIRVDPVAKTIAGKNTIRFKMLSDATRIQLDLIDYLDIDSITLGKQFLQYTRDSGAVFIDFPQPLHLGQTYSIAFTYHGAPIARGRFGGMSYGTDPAGRPWITTADEGDGSYIWFPSKDQWKDEPQEGMDISVAVPNALMDVSNGRLISKVDLKDGYTQWNWHVSYPINCYDIALNIGAYEHFTMTHTSKTFPPLSLDFYALPEDLDKAKSQFAQANGMLDAFEHYFGEYPFARDGYKLVEVPYSGMEHQTAVSYGNHFNNGYLDRDWTGVGISPRFDFIIIHESGHEWFGNAITAADRADMWIHEGWDTYLESLFVEFHYGKPDALKYLSGYVPKVFNRVPIVTERGIDTSAPQDMYFKGALMINTLRSIINDDPRWFNLLHAFFQHFKYQNILTEDVVAWWNEHTGLNLTPFFNQYLRHTAIPALELNFDEATRTVLYKWQADEPGFTMPVRVGQQGTDESTWQIIHPTLQWQSMKTPLTKDQFTAATVLYFINVSKT